MLELIIFLSIFVFVTEFSSYSVYGKFLKDEIVIKYLEDFKPFSVNPFDSSIISPEINFKENGFDFERLHNSKYISKTRLCFGSNYYISTLGRVPIWSKSHKLINELYKNTK